MDEWQASSYGDRIAAHYDEFHAGRALPTTGTTLDAVTTLRELAAEAGGRRALELAVGTGRVALPLAESGVDVSGIDASEAMVRQLRAKPGGDRIGVRMGDFADVDVEGEFDLVYLVFNTLFALTTQERQVTCFRNVAAHLPVGGLFVIEAFVPDPGRFDGDQTVRAQAVELDHVTIEVSVHDPVEQRVTAQHVVLRDGSTELYPVVLRYAWPAELDLMAELAGLRRRDRWSDWQRRPFDASSGFHITVYERPAPHPADRRRR